MAGKLEKNSYIPTVYNELALNSEELNKLYKQQLVDDIINLKKLRHPAR